MGVACTKDELDKSVFIKINNKEFHTNELSQPSQKGKISRNHSLPNQDYKNSSYNLLDLHTFLLPDTSETLLPLSSYVSHTPKISSLKFSPKKQRRRNSEISLIQLPSEESRTNSRKPLNPQSETPPKNKRRLPFSKASPQSYLSKIRNPPQFKAHKKYPSKIDKKLLIKPKENIKDKNLGKVPSPTTLYKPVSKKIFKRKKISYRSSKENQALNEKTSPLKKEDEIEHLEETGPKKPATTLPSKLNISNKASNKRKKLIKVPNEKKAPSQSKLKSSNYLPLKNDSSDDWKTISLEKPKVTSKTTPKRTNAPKIRNQNILQVKSSSDPDLSLSKNQTFNPTLKKSVDPSSKVSKPLYGSFEKQFTNLSYIKSATHSLESNASNFEQRTKIESFPDKKMTLNEAGLGKELKLSNNFTQKDFKQKKQAYNEAMQQLQSGDWEKEILGLESIVSLVKSQHEVIKSNITMVVRLVTITVKNLRSQVCRIGVQAFAEMFLHLGRSMEGESDKIIPLLLNKSVDTNKFIREDCNIALDTAMENISIYKGLNVLLESGVDHKNVVVRINTARIYSNIVRSMGAEKILGSSKEFQALVFERGCTLLADGSSEVRNHAKDAFRELSSHKNYGTVLDKFVPESQRRYIQKTLDSLQSSSLKM
ncbi:unnamed protein product [Lepeophtheirus salmonis]|uniref:(salmon louse) hypothetical protein n=1 Tax=Lepeophtheirus salmonis TaxID=72036 RepID=A0A7R8CXN6_LEPSM|nr:unnamed protein product [Lepeophtheirus salmonis]CAF2961098.1 unnamed protein product [Lepeophtheirus salmonis]